MYAARVVKSVAKGAGGGAGSKALLFSSGARDGLEAYTGAEARPGTLMAETFILAGNDGNGAYLWGKAPLLHAPDGEVTGAIGATREVTERKRTEQQVGQAGGLHGHALRPIGGRSMPPDRSRLRAEPRPACTIVTAGPAAVPGKCLRHIVVGRALRIPRQSAGMMWMVFSV